MANTTAVYARIDTGLKKQCRRDSCQTRDHAFQRNSNVIQSDRS